MQRQAMATLATRSKPTSSPPMAVSPHTSRLRRATKRATPLMALADVDPTDSEEITRLQNEVKRFRDMAEWMAKAVERATKHGTNSKKGSGRPSQIVIDPQEIED
jgi:hypothetical protein